MKLAVPATMGLLGFAMALPQDPQAFAKRVDAKTPAFKLAEEADQQTLTDNRGNEKRDPSRPQPPGHGPVRGHGPVVHGPGPGNHGPVNPGPGNHNPVIVPFPGLPMGHGPVVFPWKEKSAPAKRAIIAQEHDADNDKRDSYSPIKRRYEPVDFPDRKTPRAEPGIAVAPDVAQKRDDGDIRLLTVPPGAGPSMTVTSNPISSSR